MCGIGFTADITHDTPTATASLTNFVHGNAKTVARRHAAAYDRRAVRTYDHAAIGPASSDKVARASADIGFELGRTPEIVEAAPLRIHGSAPTSNRPATSRPPALAAT